MLVTEHTVSEEKGTDRPLKFLSDSEDVLL
jgi:hypothetical protein